MLFRSLVPFLVGIGYLATEGGLQFISFFFGNVLRAKPPATETFLAFKIVMSVFAIPATFVGAAVVLKGLVGWPAVLSGLAVGVTNWRALLVAMVVSFAFEWAMVRVPEIVPRPWSVVLALAALVAFVAWSFSFGYTLSARAYGLNTSAVAPAGT